MCGMCSSVTETRINEKQALLTKAARMEKMAAHLRDLAWSNVKPHTEQSKQFGIMARVIITDLVNEWM